MKSWKFNVHDSVNNIVMKTSTPIICSFRNYTLELRRINAPREENEENEDRF